MNDTKAWNYIYEELDNRGPYVRHKKARRKLYVNEVYTGCNVNYFSMKKRAMYFPFRMGTAIVEIKNG